MRILIIFLFGTLSLFSQVDSIQNLRIKELKQGSKKSNNTVYIKTQFNLNNDLLIFLINESTDTLKIRTESRDNYYIHFKKEIMDTSNNWKTEIPNLYCIVGDSSHIMKIPPNHYTWEKIECFKYFGNYKTKMRVSFNLDSENIVSKELEVSYNSDFLLPKEEQRLKTIDKILSTSSNLSRKDIIHYLRIKSDVYIDMKKYKKSYIFCDSIQKTDLKNDVIEFNKAKSLYKFISINHKKISELEKLSLISKNIILFENINSANKIINEKVNSYLKSLNSVLISKNEFDKKFSKTNKNYFVEINFIGIEKVKILFKK